VRPLGFEHGAIASPIALPAGTPPTAPSISEQTLISSRNTIADEFFSRSRKRSNAIAVCSD
jgi:hypothetical protein